MQSLKKCIHNYVSETLNRINVAIFLCLFLAQNVFFVFAFKSREYCEKMNGCTVYNLQHISWVHNKKYKEIRMKHSKPTDKLTELYNISIL